MAVAGKRVTRHLPLSQPTLDLLKTSGTLRQQDDPRTVLLRLPARGGLPDAPVGLVLFLSDEHPRCAAAGERDPSSAETFVSLPRPVPCVQSQLVFPAGALQERQKDPSLVLADDGLPP